MLSEMAIVNQKVLEFLGSQLMLFDGECCQ